MANTRSAKKDLRKTAKRRLRNQSTKSSLKTYIKKVKVAVASPGTNKENVVEAARLAVKAIDKAAQRGIIHKNQAARRKSRLMKVANAAS